MSWAHCYILSNDISLFCIINIKMTQILPWVSVAYSHLCWRLWEIIKNKPLYLGKIEDAWSCFCAHLKITNFWIIKLKFWRMEQGIDNNCIIDKTVIINISLSLLALWWKLTYIFVQMIIFLNWLHNNIKNKNNTLLITMQTKLLTFKTTTSFLFIQEFSAWVTAFLKLKITSKVLSSVDSNSSFLFF